MTPAIEQIRAKQAPQNLLSAILDCQAWQFHLPAELEAAEPPEARGLARDAVRLMVSYLQDNRIIHRRFQDLPHFLKAGDLLVINTSGTMNAALNVTRAGGEPLALHLSTRLPGNLWTVELRRPAGLSTEPFRENVAGETFQLSDGGSVTVHTPYQGRPAPTINSQTPGAGYQAYQAGSNGRTQPESIRLWVATLNLPASLDSYLARHGFPIRYRYVREEWPLTYYQTVYATETGSAEMPSAGRAFTPELITQLVARGVQVAPLILHTGVASLEEHEPPYEEFYRVPETTAHMVNAARATGRRIIAVGTTAVRALETVTDTAGLVHPGTGWTDLVITPQRGIQTVTGMLTGLHEPCATHLAMLEALSGRDHLEQAYREALHHGYLWHEFGDLHLILP